MLDGFLADIGGIGLLWLCLLAFGLAFGEAALFMDLFVPGEVGMVLIGAAAADAGEPVPVLVACAAAGALSGDTVSYALGRRYGRSVIHRFDFVRRRLERTLDDAEAHFDRHGGRSVFVARFVGALRAVVPFVAGIARLRLPVFVGFDAAAAVLWATLTVVLGAVFGPEVAERVDQVGWIVSVVVVGALGAWWWRRRRRQRDGDGS